MLWGHCCVTQKKPGPSFPTNCFPPLSTTLHITSAHGMTLSLFHGPIAGPSCSCCLHHRPIAGPSCSTVFSTGPIAGPSWAYHWHHGPIAGPSSHPRLSSHTFFNQKLSFHAIPVEGHGPKHVMAISVVASKLMSQTMSWPCLFWPLLATLTQTICPPGFAWSCWSHTTLHSALSG